MCMKYRVVLCCRLLLHHKAAHLSLYSKKSSDITSKRIIGPRKGGRYCCGNINVSRNGLFSGVTLILVQKTNQAVKIGGG